MEKGSSRITTGEKPHEPALVQTSARYSSPAITLLGLVKLSASALDHSLACRVVRADPAEDATLSGSRRQADGGRRRNSMRNSTSTHYSTNTNDDKERGHGHAHSGLPQYNRAAAKMRQLAYSPESGEQDWCATYCTLEKRKAKAGCCVCRPLM